MAELPFVEKYRPVSLDDICGDSNIKALKAFVKSGNFPLAIIFYGEYGTGKTTAAKALVRDYYVSRGLFLPDATFRDIRSGSNVAPEFEGIFPPVLLVDASVTRDIDTIRNLVWNFMKTVAPKNLIKFVIFDEADRLGYDAQRALRILLEKYPRTRTIYTTNILEKIDPAIQSRAAGGIFEFTYPPVEIVTEYLKSITVKEAVAIPDEKLRSIAADSESVRQAVGRLGTEIAIIKAEEMPMVPPAPPIEVKPEPEEVEKPTEKREAFVPGEPTSFGIRERPRENVLRDIFYSILTRHRVPIRTGYRSMWHLELPSILELPTKVEREKATEIFAMDIVREYQAEQELRRKRLLPKRWRERAEERPALVPTLPPLEEEEPAKLTGFMRRRCPHKDHDSAEWKKAHPKIEETFPDGVFMANLEEERAAHCLPCPGYYKNRRFLGYCPFHRHSVFGAYLTTIGKWVEVYMWMFKVSGGRQGLDPGVVEKCGLNVKKYDKPVTWKPPGAVFEYWLQVGWRAPERIQEVWRESEEEYEEYERIWKKRNREETALPWAIYLNKKPHAVAEDSRVIYRMLEKMSTLAPSISVMHTYTLKRWSYDEFMKEYAFYSVPEVDERVRARVEERLKGEKLIDHILGGIFARDKTIITEHLPFIEQWISDFEEKTKKVPLERLMADPNIARLTDALADTKRIIAEIKRRRARD